MGGESVTRGKPRCLTTREYTKLLVFKKIYSNNKVIMSVTETINEILNSESIFEAGIIYKVSLKKTTVLSYGNDVKQDLYGLSHIAYIGKLNELSS
ncbi:hypothetical protein ACQCT5_10415 [Sutcliffiella halmapala]